MTLNELKEMIEYMEEEYGPECLEYRFVQAGHPDALAGINMLLVSSFVIEPFIIISFTEEETR